MYIWKIYTNLKNDGLTVSNENGSMFKINASFAKLNIIYEFFIIIIKKNFDIFVAKMGMTYK